MTTVTINDTEFNLDVEAAKAAGLLIPLKSFEYQLEQGDIYTFPNNAFKSGKLVDTGFVYFVVLQVLNDHCIKVLRVDAEGYSSRMETRGINANDKVKIVLLELTKAGFSLKK